MKPVLEYLPRGDKESFVVKNFEYDYFPTPWHYHPEYELVLVTESEGKRFIGDAISDFVPGNLAFIGPNLPHLYRNDERYYHPDTKLKATSIVVHFLEESIGKDMLMLPEASGIRRLLERSVKGMDIKGATNRFVSEKMFSLSSLHGLERWMKLMDILHVLSHTEDFDYISHHAIEGRNETDNERLHKIVVKVMQSFHREIRLAEMADEVNMTAPAFSRYFKKRTRKTFSAFVSEIRLGHASKLLQEDQLRISEVCYASGFNNLSNFNRQFREFYNMSPMQFRKQYGQ